jgi:hypothetical protein
MPTCSECHEDRSIIHFYEGSSSPCSFCKEKANDAADLEAENTELKKQLAERS